MPTPKPSTWIHDVTRHIQATKEGNIIAAANSLARARRQQGATRRPK